MGGGQNTISRHCLTFLKLSNALLILKYKLSTVIPCSANKSNCDLEYVRNILLTFSHFIVLTSDFHFLEGPIRIRIFRMLGSEYTFY